jgi:hypothetical protein
MIFGASAISFALPRGRETAKLLDMKLSGLKDRSGQATLEYILVFVALIVVFWGLKDFFVPAVRRSAQQTAELVTSDYP